MNKHADILEMYMLYPHKYKKHDLVSTNLTSRNDDPAGDSRFEQVMIQDAIKHGQLKYKQKQLNQAKAKVNLQLGRKLHGEFAKIKKEKTPFEKQKDQKKELMSNFQIEVLMSTQKVEKMVADIDEDQNEF